MRIIIEGSRGEGKSTLATIIKILLEYCTPYVVVKKEEGASTHQNRLFSNEESRLEEAYSSKGRFKYLESRQVEIIVRNST